MLLVYALAVAGLAAVCFHWVGGKSWDASVSFALTVVMSSLGGACGGVIIRRKTGRGDHVWTRKNPL
ncbi:hypothetical protein [Streptomyces sp. NPDC048202]|uniref:hypothetical protein n=1 Tax=Streptomyces sp. NPDC048202 TaxID=3365514 RepID=UPI00371C8975